jgi:hypothetical protein
MWAGVQVLPGFLGVTGKFELSMLAQVTCSQTLFIQLRLVTLNVTAHSTIVESYLCKYLPLTAWMPYPLSLTWGQISGWTIGHWAYQRLWQV